MATSKSPASSISAPSAADTPILAEKGPNGFIDVVLAKPHTHKGESLAADTPLRVRPTTAAFLRSAGVLKN